MSVEQYYKELSESFREETERMRQNPELLDAFAKRFEEKYGPIGGKRETNND